MSDCPHANYVPVTLTGTRTTVAHVCEDCYDSLPANWGCDACEWATIQRLCTIHPQRIVTRPCTEHAAFKEVA